MPPKQDPEFPPIHVLVCGDREYDDDYIITIMLMGIKYWHGLNVHLWQGAARGADSLAGEALKDVQGVTVHSFPADWSQGKSAGPRRNSKMLKAMMDAAAQSRSSVAFGIAFKDDLEKQKDSGTADMVRKMLKEDLPVYVVNRPRLADLRKVKGGTS